MPSTICESSYVRDLEFVRNIVYFVICVVKMHHDLYVVIGIFGFVVKVNVTTIETYTIQNACISSCVNESLIAIY